MRLRGNVKSVQGSELLDQYIKNSDYMYNSPLIFDTNTDSQYCPGDLVTEESPTITRKSPIFLILLSGLLACCVAGRATAQQLSNSRGAVNLGAFITDRDSSTRINAETGEIGTDVDLEKDLGLDRSDSVFRIDGHYKFNDRHRIDASWFDLSRSSTRQIDREIEWNGSEYTLGATVNSAFDLDIYKLAYTWSFLRREKGYLGASAGLYIADFAVSLDAPAINQREVGDGTAPLPVVGLRGEYQLTDRWTFRASGELFVLEYNDWDGSLYDIYAGIDYRLTKHFSVGLAVNSVTFEIGVSRQNFRGNVDWGYSGGLIFLQYGF